MEKEFVPHEESLELKDLGFNELCFGFYNIRGFFVPDYKVTKLQIDNLKLEECCLAPTFSQAFRWFRENYNLRYKFEPSREKTVDIFIWNIVGWEYFKNTKEEEAELACLIKLIEIVKEKSNEQD